MNLPALAAVPSRAVEVRRTPPSKSQFPDLYSPGRFRSTTDAEAGAVGAFVSRHPEYAALAPEAIAQAMNLRQRRGRHVEELRHEIGVPIDWEELRSDDAGPRLAEEA